MYISELLTPPAVWDLQVAPVSWVIRLFPLAPRSGMTLCADSVSSFKSQNSCFVLYWKLIHFWLVWEGAIQIKLIWLIIIWEIIFICSDVPLISPFSSVWHLLPSRPEGGQQLAHHISFFFFYGESRETLNVISSSPLGRRAALSNLWPEVEGKVFGEAGGLTLQGKKQLFPSVGGSQAAVLSGFVSLMAATISFTVAVIELY